MSETNADVHVRIGTPRDHTKMMSFLREMHEENGVAPFDERIAEATLACGLARHEAIVGVIDGDDNDIAASVGLYVGRWWYSLDGRLEDRWVFVSPPYRRRPMARPLLEFAKNAARALGLPLLIGIVSEERTAAKVRLYEREFSRPAGAMFLFRPVEGAA